MKVSVNVQEDGLLVSQKDNHQMVLHGGQPRLAISPMEAVLGALASCSAIDVVEILHKKRKSFQNLVIDVEAERREQPYPRIFTRIHMHFHLESNQVRLEDLEKAAALSVDKYCSVAGMLKAACPVTWSVQVKDLAVRA